jgi:DNA-binding CsgD family transcriptional regulator
MRELFIARCTLRNHIYNIRKKLGAHSIREIVRLQQVMPIHAMSTLRFSPRGQEVFKLIREGLSNKHIGERLGMGVSGVKRHKEKMLLQNNCATILELIAKYHGTDADSSVTEQLPD